MSARSAPRSRRSERGAIELALEHGYEHVTVDMICDVAGISQRTFFNYVGSKEGAVLGMDLALPGDELRAAFIAGRGGGVLEDLVETLAAAFAEAGSPGGELLQKRRMVIQANPELATKAFGRLEEAEDSILQLVSDRLRTDSGGIASSEQEDEAKMVVSLTFGIMHYVAGVWMETGFPDDIGGLLRRAVALVRRVASA